MKFIIKNILIICLFCCASSLNAQHTFPYKNPLLPTEERVNDLLNRMTLQEKIAQISHLQSWDVFDGQKLNTAKLAKMCGDKGLFRRLSTHGSAMQEELPHYSNLFTGADTSGYSGFFGSRVTSWSGA